MALNHISLNDAQLKPLKHLASGGRIEARRYYPHPFKYWLMKPNGFRYATTLTIDVVAFLLKYKLIATVADIKADPDRFDYVVTDAGRASAASGTVSFDDEQAPMFGEAA